MTIDVGECVELAIPDKRLACFDAQVERHRRTVDARPAAEPASPMPAAPVAATELRPVAAPAAVARRDEPRDNEAAEAPITAKVTALRETVPNSYVITLDNGQVWRQVQPLRFQLRVGNEVQVYAPPWGDTFRLRVEGQRGFIQVAQVR